MKPAACYWSEGRFPHLISRENPPVRSSEEDIEQAIGACVLLVIELVYRCVLGFHYCLIPCCYGHSHRVLPNIHHILMAGAIKVTYSTSIVASLMNSLTASSHVMTVDSSHTLEEP